ncbi:MAG: hypothetical protein WAX77_08005 [Methylococcaceae bacterium]
MAMARTIKSTSMETKDKFTLSSYRSIDCIILFLENNLPEFASININSTLGEEDLNQQLHIFLQGKNSTQQLKEEMQFIFVQSYKEEKSLRKVDIGVVINAQLKSQSKAFFTIECKRLPTPCKARKKEYVCGNLGAMERFKREHHGRGLSHSAIIAYVEKEIFNYWFNEINNWIQELCDDNSDNSIRWDTNDLLIEQYQKDIIAKYQSKNKRKEDAIRLIHLWIKMH